jgi:hypothetical protein
MHTKETTMTLRITRSSVLGLVTLAAVLATATATASNTPEELKDGKVLVRMTFTNNGEDVSDGSLAGTGRFTAAGAISDRGKLIIYRTRKGALIILRCVTLGKKGKIAFLVKIDTNVGTATWAIASGTRGYRGLHGKGTEHENATYTASTLTGRVWR